MAETDVVVVGAGSAGIATALALSDAGVRPIVLDRADEVASSWRGRYDRLRLNTSRQLSRLPGRRFPKGTGLFPSRDDVVQHLELHAREAELDLRLGTDVQRLDRIDQAWLARTGGGRVSTREVVVATGYENTPVIPGWEGRERFEGELLHASSYRNAQAFYGRRVLVVGPGCSGMEIAYDLAEGGAAKVWLSARTPPNIVLRRGPGGVPGDMLAIALLHLPARVADAIARGGRRAALGDLDRYGLPVPPEGVFSRLRRSGRAPAIVDKPVIDAITEGRIEVVAGVEALEHGAVVLEDYTLVDVDAVICATGYARGLEPLVGHLGVLDQAGVPRTRGATPAAPGLRFVGYVPRPGGLSYMAKEARRTAKAIAGELGSDGSASVRTT